LSRTGEFPQRVVPGEVLALVEARQAARQQKDWAASDEIRQKLAGLGWQVKDTPNGPQIEPL
jgi:cysteinyl-tRNA synthetase